MRLAECSRKGRQQQIEKRNKIMLAFWRRNIEVLAMSGNVHFFHGFKGYISPFSNRRCNRRTLAREGYKLRHLSCRSNGFLWNPTLQVRVVKWMEMKKIFRQMEDLVSSAQHKYDLYVNAYYNWLEFFNFGDPLVSASNSPHNPSESYDLHLLSTRSPFLLQPVNLFPFAL